MVSLHRALILGALLLSHGGAARADGELPPDDEHAFAGDGLFRPPIEWSTWLRVAFGRTQPAATEIARATQPTHVGRSTTWELGAGIEASLALSRRGNVRAGVWLEQRGTSTDATFGGAELVLTRVPRRMDMFLYEGHGILAVRAGGSADAVTASVSYGYVAPYWLEGPCRMRFYDIYTGICQPRPERTARYMAGGRLVATVTRDVERPHVWSATIGIEVEPIGLLRMVTIARSWY